MSATIRAPRLTPSQRIARGLKYSTVGPVDLTRGTVGLGVNGVRSSAGWVGNRYRSGRIKSQLGKDLAAVQDAVAGEFAVAQEAVAKLPQAFQQARRGSRRRPRPLVLIGVGAAVLAVGAVSFSIIRRSTQPEPSTLPPSVDVSLRP